MTRACRSVRIVVSILPFLCCRSAAPAEVPRGVFTLDHVTIGASTLDDVRKRYGSADASKVGTGDEADVTICYVSPKAKTFVVFESGVMGGYAEITGFRLSARHGSGRCVSTEKDVGSLATGNGVHLGQSLDEFRKAMPIGFERRGPVLTYEGTSRRPATPDELKRLRAEWPDEKQDYYDVTTTITATFSQNELVDLAVRKIESY